MVTVSTVEWYAPLLTHYATMSATYGQSSMVQSADAVAARLFRVVEKRRPSFKYNLAPDAYIVDQFVAKLVPWCLKALTNRRMFRLSQHPG